MASKKTKGGCVERKGKLTNGATSEVVLEADIILFEDDCWDFENTFCVLNVWRITKGQKVLPGGLEAVVKSLEQYGCVLLPEHGRAEQNGCLLGV